MTLSVKNLLFLIVAHTVLLTGCKTSEQNTEYIENAILLDTVDVYLDQKPPYRPSRTREIDLIHTTLDVHVDWEHQQLMGRADLILRPYFYALQHVTLDAKGFTIKGVTLETAEGSQVLKYEYDGEQMVIALGKTYTNTDTLHLNIDYVASPNERKTTAGTAISSDKGLYFINPLGDDPTKPKQLWTQGETEANSAWIPTVDSPNERCTQEMFITVDSGMVSVSNGYLDMTMQNDDGTHTDHWIQDKPHAPYLFMMAVSNYAIVKDTWKDSLEVNYYVDPEYEPYAAEIFAHTPEMIGYFSDILDYDFPWVKYAQITAHEYVSGAMENTTAVIFGDFVQKTHREMIDGNDENTVSHELFHHWFGDLVTCESWANLPLNESFATYGEYLWLDYKYGRLEADAHLDDDLLQYLAEFRMGSKVNLIRYHYFNPDDMFDSHSYSKGGRVLHMLRKYVGDKAFFASLSLYLHEHEYQSVEIHDLRLAFEKVTGEDLNWFFDQWFLAKGHPELDISYAWDEAGKIQSVTIAQLQDTDEYPLYRLPMEVDFYVGGVTQRKQIVLDSALQTFYFELSQQPDLVNVDAEKMLLCTKTDHKTESEFIYQYAHAPLFIDKKEAIKFAAENEEVGGLSDSLLFVALNDKSPEIVHLALLHSGKISINKGAELKVKLEHLAIEAEESYIRATAIENLYEYYDDDEEVVDFLIGKLQDSSYLVISEALLGIARMNPTQAVALAKNFENEPSIDILFSVADIYSDYGNDSNESFFIKLDKELTGYDRMFITYYGAYLRLIEDPEIQKRGFTIIEKEATHGQEWFMRYYALEEMQQLLDYYEKGMQKFEELSEKLSVSNTEESRVYANLSKEYASLAAYAQESIDNILSGEKDGRVMFGH